MRHGPTSPLQTSPSCLKKLGFSLPVVRISKAGGWGLCPHKYFSSCHFNTYTPSLHHLIPPVSKTEERSRSGRSRAIAQSWTHFHVQALIPHGSVGAPLRKEVWDKLQQAVTSPFLTGDSVCVLRDVLLRRLSTQLVCLTCPIRRSSVRRVRPAASPGESAGWPGRGTEEGGITERCLPGGILAGSSMFLTGGDEKRQTVRLV